MERMHGLWKLLRHPRIYDAQQTFTGANRMLRILLADHIRPVHGMDILDLGCGTGRIARQLEGVNYLGVDNNESYVEYGRRLLPPQFKLVAGDFSLASEMSGARFDLVLAIGLLHHLTDEQSVQLLDLAAGKLRLGGRFITIDPCFEPAQNIFSRLLITLDRGGNVRTREAYEAVAACSFKDVRSFLRHDTQYHPYTHCILELCTPLNGDSRDTPHQSRVN